MQLFWFQRRKYFVSILYEIIDEKIRQLRPSDDDYPWLSFDKLRKTNPYVSSIWETIDLKEFSDPLLVNGKWYKREIDKFFKTYLPNVTTEWYNGELYITTKSINTIVREMTDYHTKKHYGEPNFTVPKTPPVVITDPRGDYFVGTPETIAKGSTIMLNTLDSKADSVQGTGSTNHDTDGFVPCDDATYITHNCDKEGE